MTVAGIDHSLTATGVALRYPAEPRWDVTTVGQKDVSGHLAEHKRIVAVCAGVRVWIGERTDHGQQLDLAVMEGPAFSRGTGKAHERAGLWWALYGQLTLWGVPILVVEPNLRAMYATGKGNAGKDEVLLAASRRWADAPMCNNNEADAVVLADMGCRYLGHPVGNLPATHLRAMTRLV